MLGVCRLIVTLAFWFQNTLGLFISTPAKPTLVMSAHPTRGTLKNERTNVGIGSDLVAHGYEHLQRDRGVLLPQSGGNPTRADLAQIER
jgi:hypothetical protein